MLFRSAEGDEIVSAKLGDAEATVEFSNGTYISLTATNSSGGDVDVTLEATSGATTVLADGFTYLELGTVTKVEPATGQVGTLVTISGERLLGGGESAKTVTLVGVSAFVTSASATSIVVRVTSSDDTNTGDVVITSDTGAVLTTEDAFTYLTASDITKVEPANGQVGTVVVITGSNLRGNGTEVETVTLAGVEASIEEESDSEVTVIAAQSTNKTGDVVVTADSGAVASLTNAFTYEHEGNVTDVSPSSGQYGTVIAIAGTSLRGYGDEVTSVSLGDVAANITFENDTDVSIVAGEGPDDKTTVDVVLVADSGAIVTAEDRFTYLVPGDIKFVDPEVGQVDTEVSITGERLCGGGTKIVSVTLCGLAATITSDNCNLVQVDRKSVV